MAVSYAAFHISHHDRASLHDSRSPRAYQPTWPLWRLHPAVYAIHDTIVVSGAVTTNITVIASPVVI